MLIKKDSITIIEKDTVKKENILKEKKIIKIVKKDAKKDVKPPKPKPKEEIKLKEEKVIERLDFKDLEVDRK